MTTTYLGLVLAALVGADAGSAQELRYHGSLVPITRDGEGPVVKEFTLYCLLSGDKGGEQELTFLVDERGGGGWAWPERFGYRKLNGTDESDAPGPQVLHDYGGTFYPLPLPEPMFANADKLAADSTWSAGSTQYQVQGKKKVGERQCWVVDVTENGRPLQTVFVDPSGLVVAGERRVFMGRGDQFALRVEFDSAKELSPVEHEKILKPVATLLTLKEKLARPEDATDPDLTEPQLDAASAVIDQLEQEAADTPFARLATVISRDVKAQRERARNVTGLADKFVGKNAPEFELKHLDGKPIEKSEYRGKILVLHFWKYHDYPLVEPYGQVGYLDFLHSRRNPSGVQVFGVAVDERFAKPETRGAAIRQTRGFRDFMNVSYTIAGDDGSLLALFGDPRQLGAKLPLWVVIDPEGRVAHYHVGYYALKPDQGLEELDAVVADLLKKQKPAAP